MNVYPSATRIFMMQTDNVAAWEQNWLQRIMSESVRSGALDGAEFVNDSAEADLVVLVESCTSGASETPPSQYLNGTPVVCMNYSDEPHGFLPGIYTSLERFRFDPEIHISWPHHDLPNQLIERSAPPPIVSADLLFSFAGSCSHRIRRKLFDGFAGRRGPWQVKEIDRWYDHTADEKEAYVEQVGRSRFVLCPHGIASYSHRIIETLAFGRVPVIIADDWVPFSIPDTDYYVRIAEKDIGRTADILLELDRGYDAYRERALRAYATHFHPSCRQANAMNRLVRLHREKGALLYPEKARMRWESRAFRRANGWTLSQRLGRRIGRSMAHVFAA